MAPFLFLYPHHLHMPTSRSRLASSRLPRCAVGTELRTRTVTAPVAAKQHNMLLRMPIPECNTYKPTLRIYPSCTKPPELLLSITLFECINSKYPCTLSP